MLIWFVILAVSSVFATLLLVPAVARLADRLGIVDEPGEARRIHTRRTPRAGGLAIYAVMASILGLAGMLPAAREALDPVLVRVLLVGGAPLLLVGILDDTFAVRPWVKVLAQCAAGSLALWLGFAPDLFPSLSPTWDGALFVGWVVLATNAYNLIDGMDGLAASVGLVALSAAATYGWLLGNEGVLLPSLVLAFSLLGFLRYNIAPASVFLGDAGSLFIGYALAVLTVAGAARPGRGIMVLLPLAALAIPVIDTAAAVTRRWLRYLPLASPDARHIHHRLLALGYGPRGVVTVVYVLASGLAGLGIVIGLAPREASVVLAGLGGVLFAWLLLYGANRLAYHEFIEAVNLLLSAPRRARQVIRTQIVLHDAIEELHGAVSLSMLNSLLDRRAGDLGVTGIAVRRATHLVDLPFAGDAESWSSWWPLRAEQAGDGPRDVLVVTASKSVPGNVGVVERVARFLTPIIEEWLAEFERRELDHVRPAREGAGGARGRRREERAAAHSDRVGVDATIGRVWSAAGQGREIAPAAPAVRALDVS